MKVTIAYEDRWKQVTVDYVLVVLIRGPLETSYPTFTGYPSFLTFYILVILTLLESK